MESTARREEEDEVGMETERERGWPGLGAPMREAKGEEGLERQVEGRSGVRGGSLGREPGRGMRGPDGRKGR